MKIKILILFNCFFTASTFAQQPTTVTPIKIDVSKLPRLPLIVETLPFFKPIFSFITDKESGCAGVCSKQISFQVTLIDTKDVVMGSRGNMLDESKTYYATAIIQYDNPSTMKFLPPSLDLQGDVLVSEQGATVCQPCPTGGIQFGCAQPFGNKATRKFTLSINTCKDGTSNPNKLSVKIDGVGLLSFNYQTIGNSTIYANNGKQIIVITMGKGSSCSPC
jgi:hypothetical protein